MAQCRTPGPSVSVSLAAGPASSCLLLFTAKQFHVHGHRLVTEGFHARDRAAPDFMTAGALSAWATTFTTEEA